MLLCMTFFALTVSAQKINVKGTIVDSQTQEPLTGAVVKEKGANNGVITNFDGEYTISVPSNATLVVTYMGFANQEVAVGGRHQIDITMEPEANELDELIVIGYGMQKKSDVTGSISSISGKDINDIPVSSTLQALQGRASGVNIIQNTGAPGSKTTIKIRGTGTVNDADPLYVVDGFIVDNIDYLNPNDIENVEIFKDAASSAVYGSRAANGVILVTTKQGKAGKIEISYNGAMGWANVYKRPQLLNAQQFMTIMDEYGFNTSGEKVDFSAYVPQSVLDKVANGWEGTDWWGAFENDNAVQQNHSVTLTGGTDRSKFAMSYTYTGNEGIMGADKASFYKRHTIRINSDHVLLKAKDFDAITIGENISIGYSKSHDLAEDGMYWSYIHSLLQTNPLVPIYADNGDLYNHVNYGNGWNDYWFSNPYEGLTKGGWNSMAESRNINTGATAFITIQPIKGLRFRSQFNYNWSSGAYRSFGEPRSPSSGSGTVTSYSVSQSSWLSSSWSVENTLTYDLPIISGHKISAMVGQSFQSTAWSANVGGSNKVNNGDQLATLKGWNSAYLSNIKLVNATDATLTGSPNDEEYLASWFGRATWDYLEKYMATVTVRYDGSSIFADGHRWGLFPSVSAGWVISNEDFMSGVKDVMDFLKFRASWGQNGNCSISKYQYLATIALSGDSGDSGYKFGSDMATSVSGTPNTGAYANIVPNPDLTWETSEQLDLGLDTKFFGNRLTFNVDWYRKQTKDLLISGTTIPLETGNSAPTVNAGDVLNRGWEFELGWKDYIGDFSYSINANLATLHNEVTYLDPTASGTGYLSSSYTRFIEGYPVWHFWLYEYDGVDENGDPKIVDQNEDGVYNNDDRVNMGTGYGKFTYGLTINLAYKNFDLILFGSGTAGNKVLNHVVYSSVQNGYAKFHNERWSATDPTAQGIRPRYASGTMYSYYNTSDAFLFNGSYFKIKQIQLGYPLPTKYSRVIGINHLRAFVSLDDWFCFTKYFGTDPEVAVNATSDIGVDVGSYPNPKRTIFGVNVTF